MNLHNESIVIDIQAILSQNLGNFYPTNYILFYVLFSKTFNRLYYLPIYNRPIFLYVNPCRNFIVKLLILIFYLKGRNILEVVSYLLVVVGSGVYQENRENSWEIVDDEEDRELFYASIANSLVSTRLQKGFLFIWIYLFLVTL